MCTASGSEFDGKTLLASYRSLRPVAQPVDVSKSNVEAFGGDYCGKPPFFALVRVGKGLVKGVLAERPQDQAGTVIMFERFSI
ncbi:hypothetical protein SNOG_14265 [Parastagonospora nodorum SN15]|uniref:Uncharacterized protein n=1 Tax=Phaeosphaeria nodorum (strain SN15 / ATCC MYA-4574 / FGSC 10173) TaxID=321614 RepID=Q0U293_PHANO|nr:hypothetical protein SNOG_14265 [Parastagonospora nodorum SN15]EAT78502.1 hypothetical protein SNOG_14265 [Parastagonospora nodorum SN15]